MPQSSRSTATESTTVRGWYHITARFESAKQGARGNRQVNAANNRERRHRIIRQLIGSFRIESQEDLRERLSSEGCEVTQATLSRDLRYLQIGKISDGAGGYRYEILESGADYEHDLLRGWLSIAFSGAVGVVKTLPGHANSVAVAIDNLEFEEILGTIAGDDTIMLVLRPESTPGELLGRIALAVPGLFDRHREFEESE
jgi:transcriptional regulator of arginine metabolism